MHRGCIKFMTGVELGVPAVSSSLQARGDTTSDCDQALTDR
jgi:hypothetical protein